MQNKQGPHNYPCGTSKALGTNSSLTGPGRSSLCNALIPHAGP